jgi:thiamine-monophosphate kinase
VTLGEFDLIARFFNRSPARADVLLGVGDDAALLLPPAGKVLVAATDTLVEGRHFLAGTPPHAIGHQALAVNLSDLAAMGADPAWALLSLSMPAAEHAWLDAFAQGLYALAAQHGVALVGGDTVRGPLVVTVQVLGFVEHAAALRRDGAKPGDHLYVSGTPGVAAAGLEMLQSNAADFGSQDPRVRRFLYAEPRLELGRALRGIATAAMDVSDGLLGDLGKLCRASGVAAQVELEALPVAALAPSYSRAACERLVLEGGDDYELLFTVNPGEVARVEAVARQTGCDVHRIGVIATGSGVRCTRNGQLEALETAGYDHFAP